MGRGLADEPAGQHRHVLRAGLFGTQLHVPWHQTPGPRPATHPHFIHILHSPCSQVSSRACAAPQQQQQQQQHTASMPLQRTTPASPAALLLLAFTCACLLSSVVGRSLCEWLLVVEGDPL